MAGIWFSILEGDSGSLPAADAVTLENGDTIGPPASRADLPVGVHTAHRGNRTFTLAVRPRGHGADRHAACFSLFVNNLRSTGSWGVGDYQDLAEIGRVSRSHGVDLMAIGPAGAIPMAGGIPGSPYSPSSRLFRSVLHIRPEGIDTWGQAPMSLDAARLAVDALNQAPEVDLRSARDVKLPVLRSLFDWSRHSLERDPEFEAFRSGVGAELRPFAVFSAAQRQFGPEWTRWPSELRHPRRAVASTWARTHAVDVLFMEWCQWQADRQFAEAARECPVLADLPVGFAPNGADSWLWQDAVRFDAQLGSPGDYFNPDGHAWDLPPLEPDSLVELGFRPWRMAVRNTLRHAAGIRIDHAFGMIRQYWLDLKGEDGRFVEQPLRPMLDLLAIEAHHANAIVVTEELGSEPGIGTSIFRDYGFLKLVPFISDQFELEQPPGYTSASCHDLPPLGSCLAPAPDTVPEGIFLDEGLRRRSREKLLRLAPDVRFADERWDIPAHIYSKLSAMGSAIVAFSPDDVLMSWLPFNLPGVPESAWPSFLARYPVTDELLGTPSFLRIAQAIRSGRRAAAPAHSE